VLARLIDRRGDARLAIGATLGAALALAAALADDVSGTRALSPGPGVYAAVVAVMLVAFVAPWLARRARGRHVAVACAPGDVTAGRRRFRTEDVAGVAIARAARGTSVAIERRGGAVAFLAVERDDEAERIAHTLRAGDGDARAGAPAVADTVTIARARRWPAIVQALVSLVGLASTGSYAAAVLGAGGGGDKSAGIVAVAAAFVGAIVFGVRAMEVGGGALAVRRGEWALHAELHAGARAAREARTARDARASAAAEAGAAAVLLRREDESIERWLSRLDGLPAGAAGEAGAYRGGALDAAALQATLEDPLAPADARIAAARLLARRFARDRATLVRVADERELRVRIAAALGDGDDDGDDARAGRRLSRLGPWFRAR
jgi:hypothetical protein